MIRHCLKSGLALSGRGKNTDEPTRPPKSQSPVKTEPTSELTRGQIDRIIQMAWEDRTSFEAIRIQFGLSPGSVIKLMRSEMTANSFKMWRTRTAGRTTKHDRLFDESRGAITEIRRFRSKGQRG